MIWMVVANSIVDYQCSAPALPVGTGRPRPPLSKKSIDFDHEIMESGFDHEIMNLVEKNVGTARVGIKHQIHYTLFMEIRG
jgi:hypothetical protein